MYQIKQLPEDFVVKEISKVPVKDKGRYLYFRLKKENKNTLEVVKELAGKLHIKEKQIGFAGSKDKKAITEQIISFFGVKKERIEKIKIKKVGLEFIGCGDRPVTLGELEGNYFEIVARNLENFRFRKAEKIINYFGEQRFGKNNIKVGECLVKKDFSGACKVLELGVKENDFIGALKKIPLRLLRLYVNAYQSYGWNETVKEAVKEGIEAEEIPLVGFGTNLNNLNKKIREIINRKLKEENLSLGDFIIKQIPELSLEGEERKVWVEVKEWQVLEQGEDELNLGKKKVKVSFILPKGSYGTEVIREMFK